MTESYLDGNRLALPDSIDSTHLFYKAEHRPFEDEDMKILSGYVQALVEKQPLQPGQIDTVGPGQFRLNAELQDVSQAYDRLCHKLMPTSAGDSPASLVYCQNALPHADEDFSGLAFVSLVLHTGPHPYVMQTLHVCVQHGFQRVRTTTKSLFSGDIIVFDPTTPHMAIPQAPHQESLLVLLQIEVSDNDETQRAEVLKLFPAAESGGRDDHIGDLTYADNDSVALND